MKIDPREMQAAQALAEAPPRLNIYQGIHKALRAMMMDTLAALGRLDADDGADVARAAERVLALAECCESHLGHENDFIHPAMEAHRPGSSAQVAGEHAHHLAALAQLRQAVALLGASQGAPRAAAALALYRQLALFVAENFQHMHFEETAHNQVLWDGYSDEALQALEMRIVASLPPEENLMVLRWMIPAMAPAERLQVLGGMQAGAPAPAFAAALDVVRPHLSGHDWARLTGGLGVPA